jgi:lipoprotein-anchoring transpeptidase ErfK/SrfK
MVASVWFRSVGRLVAGPVALAASAVLVTAAVLATSGTATPAATPMPAHQAAPPAAAPVVTELAVVTPAAHSSGTPCSPSAKACMDLSKHQAWLTDGAGHITYGPVPAGGGSKSAKTPKGTFSVLSKDAHFYSTEFHAPMPYSVFFYPGDAFHAGNPATASNGCVHLSTAAAQRFFTTLSPGDKVQIK